jgi:hypothetical protein
MAYTTIDKPSDYFNTVLWTGDGTSGRDITGVGFQPDWVWIKNRDNGSRYHVLNDSVRGVNRQLFSNVANAEETDTAQLQAFISDGFTVGSNANVNENTSGFVSWNWLASNTTASNTDGSITSTVSANTTSGFSIVSYTGNGTVNATVGHGLGVTPNVIWFKRRDSSNNWINYFSELGTGYYLTLNLTNAKDNASGAWCTPSSSTFQLNQVFSATNTNTATYIAYCFAEKKGYSKFGSYTSINSHDSNFVYLGFRPAMIIFKNTSYGPGTDWHILDRTRYTFNSSSEAVLEPNTSDAESYSAFGEVDFLSNGFKIRNDNGVSSGGYDHIYMAFAENPFVTSTGIPACAR